MKNKTLKLFSGVQYWGTFCSSGSGCKLIKVPISDLCGFPSGRFLLHLLKHSVPPQLFMVFKELLERNGESVISFLSVITITTITKVHFSLRNFQKAKQIMVKITMEWMTLFICTWWFENMYSKNNSNSLVLSPWKSCINESKNFVHVKNIRHWGFLLYPNPRLPLPYQSLSQTIAETVIQIIF